ncbi:MAG: fused MFS/spermidine synthase [Methylobacteriaceae bacterium]|nr:fused MFS/spermidine synthase [Methylobacteriaceae bacterium]
MRAFALFLVVFIIGGVLMGFEMLGSRYLYPYFGGGITTWAGLISTVLYALAIGYFAGGAIADRYPSPAVIAAPIAIGGLYLVAIPASADTAMQAILASSGYGMWGVLLASAGLLVVPVGLLGMLSPVAVRLLVSEASAAGRTAGAVYGISTFGNVCGTLVTTFLLIPTIGSRAITYWFAAALVLCAAVLLLLSRAK